MTIPKDPKFGRKPGYKHDLDGKCATRLKELKSDYPDQGVFFDENESELLFAMRSLRSEKELNYIRKHIETTRLLPDEPYQYSSSSYHAAEDVMIELLDFKRLLQKFPQAEHQTH
jgi:hypothetical protein